MQYVETDMVKWLTCEARKANIGLECIQVKGQDCIITERERMSNDSLSRDKRIRWDQIVNKMSKQKQILNGINILRDG